MFSFLQVKKWRIKEVKDLSENHTTSKYYLWIKLNNPPSEFFSM